MEIGCEDEAKVPFIFPSLSEDLVTHETMQAEKLSQSIVPGEKFDGRCEGMD